MKTDLQNVGRTLKLVAQTGEGAALSYLFIFILGWEII